MGIEAYLSKNDVYCLFNYVESLVFIFNELWGYSEKKILRNQNIEISMNQNDSLGRTIL